MPDINIFFALLPKRLFFIESLPRWGWEGKTEKCSFFACLLNHLILSVLCVRVFICKFSSYCSWFSNLQDKLVESNEAGRKKAGARIFFIQDISIITPFLWNNSICNIGSLFKVETCDRFIGSTLSKRYKVNGILEYYEICAWNAEVEEKFHEKSQSARLEANNYQIFHWKFKWNWMHVYLDAWGFFHSSSHFSSSSSWYCVGFFCLICALRPYKILYFPSYFTKLICFVTRYKQHDPIATPTRRTNFDFVRILLTRSPQKSLRNKSLIWSRIFGKMVFYFQHFGCFVHLIYFFFFIFPIRFIWNSLVR